MLLPPLLGMPLPMLGVIAAVIGGSTRKRMTIWMAVAIHTPIQPLSHLGVPMMSEN